MDISTPTAAASLAQCSDAVIEALQHGGAASERDAARRLLFELRDVRDHPRLLRLAEALIRLDPDDATSRRLQAQALIETGLASVAVPLLNALADRLPAGHAEQVEASGLLGRAWKQIFFDSPDPSTAAARAALAAAVRAYRLPFEADRSRVWHGANLLALESRARRLGAAAAPEIALAPLARELIATLEARPVGERDAWHLATLAEAALGLGDWQAVEERLRAYVASPAVPAFLVASTLRQFSEVWDIEHLDQRGRALLDILRARLLTLPDASLRLSPAQVQALAHAPVPPRGQLEAVLGTDGPKTYEWWLTGIARARSVAAIKRRLGQRVGTGFLVRAGDFGFTPADERLVMTNFHVVNPAGASPGLRPEDAQVVFEAVEARPVFDVAEIVWSAPPDRQDASLLRLRTPVVGIEPLPIARDLPSWINPPVDPRPESAAAAAPARPPRVYLIGHPGGRDLAFSFQDNELLGHEGPPAGRPPVADVCRVHYRAPTEGGSSGSPVFNEGGWELVAVHHMGGQVGMPRLNGEPGVYAANEGIAIRCVVEAIAAARAPLSASGGAAREAPPC